MRKIYFASPLNRLECRPRNEELANRLREMGHEVYLPQESGIAADDVKRKEIADGAEKHELWKGIYDSDMQALQWCDTIVAISTASDAHPSHGMCWEMGWGNAAGKEVLLVTQGHEYEYNLMLVCGASKWFPTWEALEKYLNENIDKE